jgi:tetratricopeptide (TPR) repeat protein
MAEQRDPREPTESPQPEVASDAVQDPGTDLGPGDAPDPGPDSASDDTERESAYALLQRGTDLLKRRHHAQAAIVLERAAREEPGKGSILEPLGRAYHHSGQYELARQTFEALLEVDPSAHWAHFALAASLRKLDRLAEARTHLRLAVALSPTSELYRRALAKLDAATSTTDAA